MNLKSVDMCARFCDGACDRFSGVNSKNVEDSTERRHMRTGKPGGSTHRNEAQAGGNQDTESYIQPVSDIRIAFSIDDKSGRITIKVIDNLTNEIIRHVPPEDLVSVMSWLSEFQDIVGGLVIDEMR